MIIQEVLLQTLQDTFFPSDFSPSDVRCLSDQDERREQAADDILAGQSTERAYGVADATQSGTSGKPLFLRRHPADGLAVQGHSPAEKKQDPECGTKSKDAKSQTS